jgi:hypothetical protein
MADVDPSVRCKEIEALVSDGRKLLAAAVRKLLAKLESGDAAAADFGAAARLVDLLGLDRLVDLREGQWQEDLQRRLEELDREEAERFDG